MAEYATNKLTATAQIIAFPSHRIVCQVRHGRAVVVNDTKLAPLRPMLAWWSGSLIGRCNASRPRRPARC